MSVLAIGIVLNVTTSFADDARETDDLRELSSLQQSIQQECERLEELGETDLNIDQAVNIDITDNSIRLVEGDDGKMFLYGEEGSDSFTQSEIECQPGIINSINIGGESTGVIPPGSHTIIISQSEGSIEVSGS